MNERKFNKLLKEHPYIADDSFVRSATSAKQLAAECTCTADVLIMKAEARSDLPPAAWNGFHAALAKQANAEVKINRGNDISHFIRIHRKLAITGVVIIFTLGFFTLVPVGRALAKDAFEIIISVFDGSLHAQQQGNPQGLTPIDFENLPDHFDTLESAAEAVGRPVAKIVNDSVSIISISIFTSQNTMFTIRTGYCTSSGASLVVTQNLFSEDSGWSSSVGIAEDEMETIVTEGGTIFYLGNMQDGTVFAETYGPGMNVNIASAELTLVDLKELLFGFCFVN